MLAEPCSETQIFWLLCGVMRRGVQVALPGLVAGGRLRFGVIAGIAFVATTEVAFVATTEVATSAVGMAKQGFSFFAAIELKSWV